jgi:hypothetical protein
VEDGIRLEPPLLGASSDLEARLGLGLEAGSVLKFELEAQLEVVPLEAMLRAPARRCSGMEAVEEARLRAGGRPWRRRPGGGGPAGGRGGGQAQGWREAVEEEAGEEEAVEEEAGPAGGLGGAARARARDPGALPGAAWRKGRGGSAGSRDGARAAAGRPGAGGRTDGRTRARHGRVSGLGRRQPAEVQREDRAAHAAPGRGDAGLRAAHDRPHPVAGEARGRGDAGRGTSATPCRARGPRGPGRPRGVRVTARSRGHLGRGRSVRGARPGDPGADLQGPRGAPGGAPRPCPLSPARFSATIAFGEKLEGAAGFLSWRICVWNPNALICELKVGDLGPRPWLLGDSQAQRVAAAPRWTVTPREVSG